MVNAHAILILMNNLQVFQITDIHLILPIL